MSVDKKVVVTQLRLTHYRVAFFEELRRELGQRGIRMVLLHGQPDPGAIGKRDEGNVEWAIRVENRYWRIGNKYLAWQPFPSELGDADLIVITQENRILSNYLHLLRRYFGGSNVAFWGHGANLQSHNRDSLLEGFKRWTTNRVAWWFAYTKMSADLVAAAGFPAERISVLDNSIDTSGLRQQVESVTLDEKLALRRSFGLGDGPVGIFTGSLYADKRIDFMLTSAELIRKKVPDFHFLIVGEGVEQEKIRSWCENHPWAHWAGARFGRDKAMCLSVAHVMLNPGAVGLSILDSFASGVPLVSTNCQIHGPEIAYLIDGKNGVMAENDVVAYADSVVDLLSDASRLKRLASACVDSAAKYTVENMAAKFADGVEQALGGLVSKDDVSPAGCE